MAGTTALEPATSAVTESNYFKNHGVADDSTTPHGTVSRLKSIGAKKLYLRLYLNRRNGYLDCRTPNVQSC